MKLGPVRWHLKKQGAFELSADKARLVVGDMVDSTISIVESETGYVVATLEQLYYHGGGGSNKRTSLVIDRTGHHVAINTYHSDRDSIGWEIVHVGDGAILAGSIEQYLVRAFSFVRDRVVVYDIGTQSTGQLTIRRLSDNSVIKSLVISGWAEYEEETGRLFVIADRIIRAFDITSGEEIDRWGVDKADAISKDPRSDWIYATTRIASGNSQDPNLVECVNIAKRNRIEFEPDAFAGDCASCLGFGSVHLWSSSAESSYLNGELLPGQRNPLWRVDAADSSVRLWLNPRFYFNGRPAPHVAAYLDEHKYYIHMFSAGLDSGGIWCHDVVPNTTSYYMGNEERDYIEVVEEDLFVRQSGSSAPISSIIVTSIDGRVIHRHDVGADAGVPIRIPVGTLATGVYVCTIIRAASSTTQTFTVIR